MHFDKAHAELKVGYAPHFQDCFGPRPPLDLLGAAERNLLCLYVSGKAPTRYRANQRGRTNDFRGTGRISGVIGKVLKETAHLLCDFAHASRLETDPDACYHSVAVKH